MAAPGIPSKRAALNGGACSAMRLGMESLLLRLSDALPAPARAHATPERLLLLGQFLRFGVVGTLGFAVDTAVVYALRGSLGLYGAGAVSFLVAGSVVWSLNRAWTFRGRGRGAAAHRQWALFLLANLLGFVLNRGAYALLVAFSPLAAAQPVLATAAGAVSGMFVNFALSRAVVFR
jgi:putative flippase GtrA